ncbi:CsbD family protein [Streptomyces sp. NBC_00829]|uniref:CsbD family protein n=1 Tax=Streptomyces sp. NBC_00829 TaxID=2903679 RepID=UPI00386CD595|nr:CsbD family protein [Streptomyces sp. NBC_00829]
MSVAQRIRHNAQVLKGRITESVGRATRNRRRQRHGRTDRVAGNLTQSTDRAKKVFKR